MGARGEMETTGTKPRRDSGEGTESLMPEITLDVPSGGGTWDGTLRRGRPGQASVAPSAQPRGSPRGDGAEQRAWAWSLYSWEFR